MKKCPFCAEEIQDQAIKCRFCNEFLNQAQANKWYFKPSALILGFFISGPFILPVIWKHPTLSRNKKITITIIICAVLWLLVYFLLSCLSGVREYYTTLFEYLG